ncbi:MAG: hypothetical protein A3C03_02345 [Candidatus Colwellbacteria bacterium RIFCSPHIGHO2_02_FULL_45_17]|uniref:Uncharacterized protein n=1 Tax=Candidatus Colwellbacteria bacterium RIFCSPLOWO2_02_FULL_45_11 TaxID=1797692 RepID=A0A1G1Z8C2_9BACT|nr:MAG: hypothetical protein A3C03_02345 [Candidatus Colwellbacteria bacterium RIFCSPHIGHO2_02_FULL_45_17]OGY60903.1 MAG: hypothetical protein A3I33_02170 [Candidatus Colwellbacteria bacterium RIFCSPLOWO2_02_FULL_45_11]
MLITLYGPDSYRRIKKLDEIIGIYRDKYTGLSYERIDVSLDGSLKSLKNIASTRSMFDPVRLIVVDSPLEAEDQKELRAILKSNTENKELTIVINSLQKPPATYKFLYEKPASAQEFPALKGEGLNTLIKQLADEYGVKIDTRTRGVLIDLFGSNTWGLATEIEQFSLGKAQDIEARPAADYFQLISTLKRGYSARERVIALELILSERKDEPARVFNSLAYRLSNNKEANRFADYDVAIKSGKLEYEEILLDLALGS